MNIVDNFKWKLKDAEKKFKEAEASREKARVMALAQVPDKDVLEAIFEKPYLYMLFVVGVLSDPDWAVEIPVIESNEDGATPAFDDEDFRRIFSGLEADVCYMVMAYFRDSSNFGLFFNVGQTPIPLLTEDTEFYENWTYGNRFETSPAYAAFAERCKRLIMAHKSDFLSLIEEDGKNRSVKRVAF